MNLTIKLLFFYLIFSSFITNAQNTNITLSGSVKDKTTKTTLPFVSIIILNEKDSAFVTGSLSDESGRFSFPNIKPGNYVLEIGYIGYAKSIQPIYVGSLSSFIEIPTIELAENSLDLNEVTVTAKQDEVSGKLDKKVFSMEENISQNGGSVLQSMQNLPGVSVQDGKIQLRGNDKVAVLIDGKQTALTGMGSQSGLDNIPASSIEKIEIINNPSAKYDANGNAGIINIIYKKNKQEGWNGKAGMTLGVGALWLRKENLPNIRPQYQNTPKINPSLSLNFKKKKVNLFLQSDYLYTETLNKNEFITRTYSTGESIKQQIKRNRNTSFATVKTGIDWNINNQNTLSISGMYGLEKIIDRGDEPFYNFELSQRYRLWQFLEDEVKTTAMATSTFHHQFNQPGHVFNTGVNYTFHREDEKYFFDNIMPNFFGKDAFVLISDEQVIDFNFDYIRPLKYGKIEGGIKIRNRDIPTNMQFYPGLNSPIDSTAGGPATYKEFIPAIYSNYIFENKKIEVELGLRIEYVKVNYVVGPDHPTYKSDEYNYTQPFPNMRVAYKINDNNKLSLFYNRRVDRPNEVDIRIFPKYDDAEIIKVGNPALRPQFTHLIEIAYKTNLKKGYIYSAAYHRIADGTITRIASTIPNSNLIYSIFQNAKKSYNTGIELIFSQNANKWLSYNLNLNYYFNSIDAFEVENIYPVYNTFRVESQNIYTGNVKLNAVMHITKTFDAQFTAIYLAPNIIPQGKIAQRYSIDLGLKKKLQKGKGELFLNANDLANTMLIKKEIKGNNFQYTSSDYNETQVFRIGYNYKF